MNHATVHAAHAAVALDRGPLEHHQTHAVEHLVDRARGGAKFGGSLRTDESMPSVWARSSRGVSWVFGSLVGAIVPPSWAAAHDAGESIPKVESFNAVARCRHFRLAGPPDFWSLSVGTNPEGTMGEVIRKGAAAADILADVETTYTRARAKGGDWQAAAEARLGPVLTLATGVRKRLDEARKLAEPAIAQFDVEEEACDKLVGRISDDVWNAVGRPAADPALDILFPGGISYYTEGRDDEQPVRMQLLADLLESGIHEGLPAEQATAFAAEIRQAATRLEERADAVRPLRARVKLSERMLTAVARHAQIALSRLKAQWKADGKTEAEIHSVIPDRPSKPRVKSGGGEGGDPTPTPQ